MRVFQIIHSYPPYLPRFESKFPDGASRLTYEQHRQALLDDRFYAVHLLQPPAGPGAEVFCTLWDYPALQIKWARERGWAATDLKAILRAQIEEYKPDVLYSCSPHWFTAEEVRRLAAGVPVKVAWFASPEIHDSDFSVYDAILSNFPGYLAAARRRGLRPVHFEPACDPEMAPYAARRDRPVDILFYGQYLDRYFQRRNRLVDQLIRFRQRSGLNIRIALQYNTTKRTILPDFLPVQRLRFCRWQDFPPARVKANCDAPLYGRDLYAAIGQARLVLNAATDFAGPYRVNMRNLEAMGCGAHLIGEAGIYPEGIVADRDFTPFRHFRDFEEKARYFLARPDESRRIAEQGRRTVTTDFAKEHQWSRFVDIVSRSGTRAAPALAGSAA